MRKQNHLSDASFALLADMIGGHTLRYERTDVSGGRWFLDGKPVGTDEVGELRRADLIWHDHDENVTNVAFHPTRAGYAYVRSLADA